jgi:uncharacterized membrane protein YesL
MFNLDSPLIRFLNLMADVMIVSGLWILGSIPIITIGTSTSAAYYVMTRRISNRESYVLKDYFKAYKENFVTTVLVFVTLIAILFLVYLNILNISFYGPIQIVALPMNIILGIEAVFVYMHVFPLASRFDMKYKTLMRSAFLMANKHLITSVAHAALFVGVLFISYLYPLLILFAFGIYCWLSSYLLMRVYRKYRPELDKDEEINEGSL